MISESILKLIKGIDTRITNLIKLGKVSRFIDDDREIPVVQVNYLGDITGNAAVVLPYGMSAGLPEDTLGIVLSYYGNEANRLFIPLSTTTRVKGMKRKETAYGYGDQTEHQSYIKFDEEGNIIIKTNKVVKLEASEVEVDGNLSLTVNGNVDVDSGTGVVTLGASRVNLDSGGTLKKIVLDGDPVIGGGGGTVQSSANNYST